MLEQIFKVGQYPNLPLQGQHSFGARVATLFKTYGILFLALIAVSPTISMVDYFVTHVLHYKTISGIQKHSISQFVHKMGYWKAVIYISLIGPLLEETVFRLPLTLKKRHIGLAFATAAFLFCGLFFKDIKSPWLNISTRLLLSAIIYVTCIKTVPDGLSIIDHRFRKQIIILSMCLFGLMHIANYAPIQWRAIWIYPVYVAPQFLMGWAITYIRFKNGFWWGVVMHCLINSVSIALSSGRL